MLKNIYLEIEYDGTNYFGWQIQSHQVTQRGREKVRTIQGELEKAIEKLFNKKIKVSYSGRTDRGVHAKSQVANFKIATKIPKENIKKALNSYLPAQINIKKVRFVPLDFHSRFNIKSKVYRYIILNKKEKDVFLRNYSWWIPQKLNMSKMVKASKRLIGKKDFSAFTKEASKYKSCVREIRKITIRKRGSLTYIDIEASGFLRGMVRNIVSFLVDIGLEKIDLGNVKNIIKSKNRAFLGKPAPCFGLYLWKVHYYWSFPKIS